MFCFCINFPSAVWTTHAFFFWSYSLWCSTAYLLCFGEFSYSWVRISFQCFLLCAFTVRKSLWEFILKFSTSLEHYHPFFTVTFLILCINSPSQSSSGCSSRVSSIHVVGYFFYNHFHLIYVSLPALPVFVSFLHVHLCGLIFFSDYFYRMSHGFTSHC